MKGIVEDHSVELHQILNGGPTADVELASLVSGGDNPGHYLQGAHQIGLAAY